MRLRAKQEISQINFPPLPLFLPSLTSADGITNEMVAKGKYVDRPIEPTDRGSNYMVEEVLANLLEE